MGWCEKSFFFGGWHFFPHRASLVADSVLYSSSVGFFRAADFVSKIKPTCKACDFSPKQLGSYCSVCKDVLQKKKKKK